MPGTGTAGAEPGLPGHRGSRGTGARLGLGQLGGLAERRWQRLRSQEGLAPSLWEEAQSPGARAGGGLSSGWSRAPGLAPGSAASHAAQPGLLLRKFPGR